MPTKRQLQKMRESEMEYPQIRRSDDPMFNSVPSASNDAKPIVTGSAIVEICWKSLDGGIYVNYRREVGTEDAKSLMAQVDEHIAKYGEDARYFYRIAT